MHPTWEKAEGQETLHQKVTDFALEMCHLKILDLIMPIYTVTFLKRLSLLVFNRGTRKI